MRVWAIVFALPAVICSADAASSVEAADRLERVVILMRHGVRAAMSTPQELQRYSVRAWPTFSVPPGYLTPKGAMLVEQFGRYYRAHYQRLGLFEQESCDAAAYFWANRTQRTEATARALAEGLLPACKPTIHRLAEGIDPLFEAPAAGVGAPDYAKVRAAILGRMGGDPDAWSATQSATVAILDALLLQCEPAPCPDSAGKGKRRLRDTPSRVDAGGPDQLVSFTAPAAMASGITESLLMGYADGQSFADAGWRGITEQALSTVFTLHAAQFDLRARTPYVVQVTSSYLASRLLVTLRAGAGMPHRSEPTEAGEAPGSKRPGLANQPIGANQPILVITGHDGTLVQLGGLLGVDWIVPGYARNQAVPGGALVFEIWKRADDGRHVLRLHYTAQSLRQLHEGAPLTESAPPLIAPIFIPGCSEANAAFDCPLERFTAVIETRIDPDFVRVSASHGRAKT